MDGIKEPHETYGEIVKCWAEEREILGIVQPYTAQKAEQKASLFFPWLEDKRLEEIEATTIRSALIELRQHGGVRQGALIGHTARCPPRRKAGVRLGDRAWLRERKPV